jgi:hypothetical protein
MNCLSVLRFSVKGIRGCMFRPASTSRPPGHTAAFVPDTSSGIEARRTELQSPFRRLSAIIFHGIGKAVVEVLP